MLTRREWYFVGLSGVLLALSFPPLPTGPLAWIALVPLFLAIERASPWRAAAIGYAFALVYHLAALYWIAFHVDMPRWLAVPGWLMACIIPSIYTACSTLAMRLGARWLGRTWIWLIPPAWVAGEYARFYTELAFPWTTIGHTQSRLLGIIQQADVWGVLGVSFWVIVLNVLAYGAVRAAIGDPQRALRNPTLRQCSAAFVIVLMVAATYGRWRLAEQPAQRVAGRIAIVQPNIDMGTKWGSSDGVRQTKKAIKEQTLEIPPGTVDLVIWPETAIPDYLAYQPDSSLPGQERSLTPRYEPMFRLLTNHLGVPLITGAPVYDYGMKDAYNSAIMVSPESLTVQSYDKIILVPFGERVPYESTFGFLKSLNLGMAHWLPGERETIFRSSLGKLGVAICFESVFPALMRSFIRNGADILVVVTNDAWFGRTSLIYQHADFASFRAIECRTWIARSANTGISAFIDPWGRRVRSAHIFERTTLVSSISRRERETLYLRYGDWIAVLSAIATLVAAAGGIWAGRQEGDEA